MPTDPADQPTTAAQMALEASVDEILSDALEVEFVRAAVATVVAMHGIRDRYLRGELSEEDLREVCFALDLSLTAIERLREHTRELDRKQHDDG